MEIPREDVAEIDELVRAEQKQLVEELILKLHEIGAVKLGNFKLKSGVMSPIYVDLRVLPSHPRVLERVVDSMWRCLTASVGEQEARKRFTHVCGVPYGALPFAAAIAIKHQVPMVICRKEAKDYGTKNLVEGVFNESEKVLILEDVITSGISIQETSTNLRSAGLTVEEAVVFLDRQQGGRQRLAALENGLAVTVHAVTSLRQMLETLKAHGRIEESLLDSINEYLASMAKVTPTPAPAPAAAQKPQVLTFEERVDKCKSGVGKKLLRLMEQKKSNLSVAADVTTKSELLALADKLGPHICMLKTHADIVQDWDANTGKELKELAQKHHFLLFEDRKFADIGYVAQQQYGGGPFSICDWADIVTVHLVAGASVVTSLKETAAQKGQERGALLIAQMSTSDAASKQEEGSVERALAAARAHTDFVVGFICQENVLAAKNADESPSFLYCTPGVRIGSQGDGLGQTYRTPETVISSGCDVAIVGRGVCSAADPVAAAREYQEKAWAAYTARCSGTA